MSSASRSTLTGMLALGRRRSQVMITVIVAAFSVIISTSSLQLVHGQGFEDLNKQHNTFQPQQAGQRGLRHSFQRPVLSNRFASSQLAAQASSSATTFSDPPPGALVAAANQPPQGASNIEQMMKNALARTAQLNSAAESRADVGGEILTPKTSLQRQPQETTLADRQGEASENTADTRSPSSSPAQESASQQEEQVTTRQPTTTTNGHETVYSDLRFANLFARRNQLKKSRIQPTEQVKAKPTLPSFIKSLPDPKQFNANQAAAQDIRPTPGSSPSTNSFSIGRQQQGRLQGAGSTLGAANKKPIITSTSAANASNKRAAAQGQKLNTASSAPKPSAALKATTSKPTGSASNNPFSRSQSSSSNDPANVIAMARKRLLANNALESAKLKQQTNSKQQASN